jgi:DNA polymerase-1
MKCKECTLSSNIVSYYIPSHTQYNCLIVGQAPGSVEVITGVPFTGGAGKMLYRLMKEAGLNKNNFFQTNLVQCKPPNDDKGNDRAPTSFEIKCCFRHLYEEIQGIKPELILALGGPAMYALTGHEGPMSLRGSFHPLLEVYQHECQVLCLLHPSFVMKQRQWINIAINDLKLIHSFFVSGLPKKEEYSFTLDPSAEELNNYLSKNNSELPTTFDIETTSLDPFEAQVIGIGFSNSPTSAMAIAYKGINDPRLPVVKRFLESIEPEEVKCAQNGSYDCKVLNVSQSVKVKNMSFDTRLAEQLLNSDMPKNLDHLRATYTQIKPYKPTKKEMKTIQSWNKDTMLEYCCWDNITTYQVMQAQSELLTIQQKLLLKNLLVPLIETINSMEIKGVQVDVNRLALMYAQSIPVAEAIKTKVETKYKLNPSSPKQVTKYFNLKESSKLTLKNLIKAGHEKSDLLQDILDYRDLTKGAGTFLKGVYERLKDNRIHTQYNIEGTGTGRLSSENPNLQNVPKPFRVIYTADTEDDILISGDFSQLELWVVSVLGPCPPLYKILIEGGDIHLRVEEAINDYLPENLLNRRRLIAKSIVFGTLYGLSSNTIATTFSVTREIGKKWQGIFLDIAGLDKYYSDCRHDFQEKGYVTTPFGRKRYIQTFPQALNAPVQSTASDVTLTQLNKCYYESKLDLRLQVHDEIVIHSSKKDLKKNSQLLKDTMESLIPELNQRFKVNIKAGYNWFEMKEVKNLK